MIEVLVSLFILGFGIMGAAAMQLTALRTAQHSGHQTAALRLAMELADSMHATRHVTAPSDPGPSLDNPYLEIDFGSGADASEPAIAPQSCYTAVCDANTAIATHIRDWSSRLSAALPAGRAKICRDATPWSIQEASYTWDCHPGTVPEKSAVVIKIGWRKKPDPGVESSAAMQHTDFPPGLVMPIALATR